MTTFDFTPELTVNCYSGYTYAERPVSFRWRGKEYQVQALEKTWQQPGQRCFQVRTEAGQRFQLGYHEVEDQWSIVELAREK